MHKHSFTYDVVIIGGGCAGASTALSLLQQGIQNIAIVEKSDFSRLRVGETIQPPTSQILKQLGVWDEFINDKHLNSLGVASAWGTSELDFSDFIFKTHGKGWHLHRNKFDQMMLRMAVKNGTRVVKERLTRSVQTEAGWEIHCEATILNAKLVVDATGRSFAFAKQQGSHKIIFDDLHGIYTHWTLSEEVNESFNTTHTLVESVEKGWWYSALLPNNQLAVAFMTDTQVIKNDELKNNENYLSELAKAPHTQQRIKNLTQLSQPSIKVANAYELDQKTGENWLAVGDSASAFDPLSSYGIHKAMQNAIRASECVKLKLEGDTSAFKTYEEEINKAFESFLETRIKFYGMETRWKEHHFWKSRQNSISIHPMQPLNTKEVQLGSTKRWNRILSEKDMDSLIKSCKDSSTAIELVQQFQKDSPNKYPDWRIIQAVSYLYEKNAIG